MGNKIKKTDDVKRGYVNILLVTYPSYINGTRASAPHVVKEYCFSYSFPNSYYDSKDNAASII